jgi:Leucine-rich repeat (LRR) protein
MPVEAPPTVPDEAGPVSIRLPSPLWIGAASVALVIAGVGLRVVVQFNFQDRQQIAIRDLRALGGGIAVTSSSLPDQLLNFVDDDWRYLFDEVVGADFREHPATDDAMLGQVRWPSTVTFVFLAGTRITDSGVAGLTGLTRLERLSLRDTQITDRGLQHLGALTRLRNLTLDGTDVTDAGLDDLAPLTKLQALSLDGTQVTDRGMPVLNRQTGLRYLWLGNTTISDAGLAQLKGLRRLQQLCLTHTNVTDAGVAELQRSLPELLIRR